MQNNTTKILPLEKIISILSYISMGIIGFLWIIFAYKCKRKLKFFLMYNICQSMVISIFLVILKTLVQLIFIIFSKIPFLDPVAGILNLIISVKIIRFSQFGLSFSIVQLLLFLLFLYLIIGICFSKMLYVPILTKFMQKVMNRF